MKKTLATKQVFNYKTSKNRKTKIITKNRKMKMISLRTITIRKPQASGKLYLHLASIFLASLVTNLYHLHHETGKNHQAAQC